jgi:hypothetical protein
MALRVTIKTSTVGMANSEAEKHNIRLFAPVKNPTKDLVHADVEDKDLPKLVPWITAPNSRLTNVVGTNINVSMSR